METKKNVGIEKGKLKKASLENTCTGEITKIPVDGIFVFIGHRPNTEMFSDVVTLSGQGFIKTDCDMLTSLSGVFAAGDVVEKKYRQIPTAMGDGAVAALSAGAYLRKKMP